MSTQRKVIQYDCEGRQMRTFDSIHEAQDYLKITHISSVCRRKRKSDGGFRWRYADEASAEESEE